MFFVKKKILSRALLILLLFSGSDAAFGAQKYGFSSGVKACALWDTFFPISFQIPYDIYTLYLVKPQFNIIYVADGNIKHMDDFYDLYRVGNQHVWPTSPDLANGRSKAICQNDGDCVSLSHGSVGKGISAYKDILRDQSFRNDIIKVLSNSPHSDGSISWLFLPTRKLKLLRVELFTPGNGTNSNSHGSTEPLFFEYRATGQGDEMQLIEFGGTAAGSNFNDVKLPKKLNLITSSAIQVWLTRTNIDPLAGLLPAASVVNFTTEQMKLIPANCQ